MGFKGSLVRIQPSRPFCFALGYSRRLSMTGFAEQVLRSSSQKAYSYTIERSRTTNKKGGVLMDNKQEFQPANIHFERRRFKRISGTYVVSYAPIKGEELKFDIS